MLFRNADKAEIRASEIVPLKVVMGWSDGISKSDAVELARGYIQKRFTSGPESGWYAVAPFMGGFMWEVQEGGPGKAYMPAVLDALSRDPGGRHWFPCGDRVFQVMMRDGKPFAILLSSADSRVLIASGAEPLMPGGRMARAAQKGMAVLVAGSTLFGSGLVFMAGAMTFYGLAADPVPAVKDVKLDMAPHAQWSRVAGTPVTEVVTKIELVNGAWKVERRPHVIEEEKKPVPLPSTRTPEREAPSTDAPGSGGASTPATNASTEGSTTGAGDPKATSTPKDSTTPAGSPEASGPSTGTLQPAAGKELADPGARTSTAGTPAAPSRASEKAGASTANEPASATGERLGPPSRGGARHAKPEPGQPVRPPTDGATGVGAGDKDRADEAKPNERPVARPPSAPTGMKTPTDETKREVKR